MIEQNREAVLAIQGGGMYAFTLLGQAKAIIDAGYVPLAFAGTSGGAILASLLWSGLTPEQIESKFRSMVDADARALLRLLAPMEAGSDRDDDAFSDLEARFGRLRARMPSASKKKRSWLEAPKAWLEMLGAGRDALDFWERLRPHVEKRGLFTGERLEREIDDLIRQGFGLDRLPQPIRDRVRAKLPPPGDLVRFGHVRAMMAASNGAFYVPPLLLTATNLTRRKLEIFSSLNPAHETIPVATAVRASAGFPAFFRPTQCTPKEWYVDGGLVSNFPVWAFSDAFREQSAADEFHGVLASRPWMRIGLRVVDDAKKPPDLQSPKAFLESLTAMLTGSARNELEDILAQSAPRSIIVRQPESTTNCPGVLSISEVDGARIGKMVESGYAAARKELADCPGIYSDSEDLETLVVAQLARLVEECSKIFADPGLHMRANIFMPVRTRLKMCFSFNMDGDPDHMIEMPGLSAGVVGACYRMRSWVICNLDKVGKLREQHPDAYRRLFDMDDTLHGKVRKDRSWLASVPIFDPLELKTVSLSKRRSIEDGVLRVAMHAFDTGYVGPILGVLSIDANLDYEKIGMSADPDIHFEDWRVRAVSAILQARALTIGAQITT